jgi:hypothetical protein
MPIFLKAINKLTRPKIICSSWVIKKLDILSNEGSGLIFKALKIKASWEKKYNGYHIWNHPDSGLSFVWSAFKNFRRYLKFSFIQSITNEHFTNNEYGPNSLPRSERVISFNQFKLNNLDPVVKARNTS